jgi:hypothetical protein
VKLWNLKFAVGDTLSHEAARVYCDEMPNGNKTVPDQTLFAAFDRQKIPYEVRRSDRTPYLLIPSQALKLRKPTRAETIQLEPGRGVSSAQLPP